MRSFTLQAIASLWCLSCTISRVESFGTGRPPFLASRCRNGRSQLDVGSNGDNTLASINDDCGCPSQVVEFGGDPSARAQSLNHYEAIRNVPFQRVSGEQVTMDNLISSGSQDGVSIAVFLRSLG